MAALRVFTPFVDKENSSNIAPRKSLKSGNGGLKAHVGKTFQSNNIGQTPIRRALGSVNANITPLPTPQQQQQKQQLKNPGAKAPIFRLHPPAPGSKPHRQPRTERPSQQVVAKEIAPTTKFNIYYDEPERMPLPAVDEIDDMENVWPAAERPATYLKELKEWRVWPFDSTSGQDFDYDREISVEDDIDPLESLRDNVEEDLSSSIPVFDDIHLLTLADLDLPPTWEELEQELTIGNDDLR